MVLWCMAALISAFAPTSHAFKREYKMQVTVGPNYYWGRGAAKFAELVKLKTAGRIKIKPYYGSSLLRGAQLKSSQLVSMGVIDCALDSTINISPVIPECNVFSLPFFINTYDNLDRLENGKTGSLIFSAMKKKGLKPLAWGENGFRQITCSKKAILSPADLKGLTVRVVGSPIFIDIFRTMGADPVNMNWGDAITAFQQGVVDAQENPVGILLSAQIWQYHRRVTFWNYMADPLIFYWSLREWRTFSPGIQKSIMAAAVEAGRYEKALVRAGLDNGESLLILEKEFNEKDVIPDPTAYMKGKNMRVIELDSDKRAQFKRAVAPVYEKWEKKIGKEVVKSAKQDMAK
ncbi:MAG: hypothetical protein GXP53_11885 [Deltaproteobacteria bacterium]|nr:hypothetical protein [Deltaproteobacteria bacterium]